MLRYYHYRKLSSKAQEAYTRIASSIKGFKAAAVINTVPNLQKVIDAVKNDNPHFFYVNWGNLLYTSRMQREKTIVYFRYRMSRPDAKWHLAEIAKIADRLKGRNAFITMLNVHDCLAQTVTYNPEVKRNSSASRVNDHNVIGPLFEKMAVCEGIARAYQILLKHLNVECTYMCGFVDTSNVRGYHAWNWVVFNGKICKVDVTWDLGDREAKHSYFITPSDYFGD